MSLNRKFPSEVLMHNVDGVLDVHSPCKSSLLHYFSVSYWLLRTPKKEGKEEGLYCCHSLTIGAFSDTVLHLLKAEAMAIHVFTDFKPAFNHRMRLSDWG